MEVEVVVLVWGVALRGKLVLAGFRHRGRTEMRAWTAWPANRIPARGMSHHRFMLRSLANGRRIAPVEIDSFAIMVENHKKDNEDT